MNKKIKGKKKKRGKRAKEDTCCLSKGVFTVIDIYKNNPHPRDRKRVKYKLHKIKFSIEELANIF